jgi:hypothetical protein
MIVAAKLEEMMLKIMAFASTVMLLGAGTAVAISDKSDKLPDAKNSHFQMLAEQGTPRRTQQSDSYDPKSCGTRTDKNGKTYPVCPGLEKAPPPPGQKSTGPTAPPKPPVNR